MRHHEPINMRPASVSCSWKIERPKAERCDHDSGVT